MGYDIFLIAPDGKLYKYAGTDNAGEKFGGAEFNYDSLADDLPKSYIKYHGDGRHDESFTISSNPMGEDEIEV